MWVAHLVRDESMEVAFDLGGLKMVGGKMLKYLIHRGDVDEILWALEQLEILLQLFEAQTNFLED